LNSGSITSGFGTIDTGSSAITTTGLISGGSLDIDNVLINGTTIGHTDDTDLITLADGVATVAGELSVTTLDIGGTNVTSTAAELNILDGVTATATELNLIDGYTGTTAELNYNDVSTVGTVEASKTVTADASGTVNHADLIVQRPRFTDYAETINAIGSTGGGTQDIDITAGNVVSATVDTSTNTFTFSNPSATGKACSFTLFLTNGGSQTVNWPSSVDWAGGTAPSLTSSGVDVLTFTTLDAGTIWYGFAAGTDMK
jgi:hypothetical protein